MSNKTKIYTNSIQPATLLGVAFIVLKLCAAINWSWLWVLSPFWMPLVLAAATIGLIILVPLIGAGLYMLGASILNLFNKWRK